MNCQTPEHTESVEKKVNSEARRPSQAPGYLKRLVSHGQEQDGCFYFLLLTLSTGIGQDVILMDG